MYHRATDVLPTALSFARTYTRDNPPTIPWPCFPERGKLLSNAFHAAFEIPVIITGDPGVGKTTFVRTMWSVGRGIWPDLYEVDVTSAGCGLYAALAGVAAISPDSRVATKWDLELLRATGCQKDFDIPHRLPLIYTSLRRALFDNKVLLVFDNIPDRITFNTLYEIANRTCDRMLGQIVLTTTMRVHPCGHYCNSIRDGRFHLDARP